jgi:hypothetical protein
MKEFTRHVPALEFTIDSVLQGVHALRLHWQSVHSIALILIVRLCKLIDFDFPSHTWRDKVINPVRYACRNQILLIETEHNRQKVDPFTIPVSPFSLSILHFYRMSKADPYQF